MPQLIAGFIGTALGLGAVATNVLAFGLTVGAQYLLQGNRKKPKKRTYTAFQSETEMGGSVPRSAGFGIFMTKGHEIRYFKWGSGNKYNASVIQLSDGWCDGLEPYVIMSGQRYDLVSKTALGNEVSHWGIKGFEDLTSIRFYDGRPGQQVDPKLVSDTASTGNPWKTTSTGSGVCYVVFEKTYDSRWEFDPDPHFVVRGLRLYDPRLDSTQPGGKGDHRLDDPTTWAFSRNPAIQRLNYLMGFRAPLDSDKPVLGTGKSLAEIDVAAHVGAANVADARRTVNFRPVPTYQTDLIFNSEDDFTEILTELDDGMAADGTIKGGIASVIAGAPRISTFEITDDDIRVDENITRKPRKNRDETFNALTGQFTSIDALFQPASLEPVRVNADIEHDNGVKYARNDLLQITDPDIAQYVQQITYRKNRIGGFVSIPVTDRMFFALDIGDWGTYRGQLWRCIHKDAGRINLERVSSEIYASKGITPGPVVYAPAAPENPALLSALDGFGVSAGYVRSADGARSIPALRCTWTPPQDDTITGIRITYTTNEDTPSRHVVVAPDPEAGEYTITPNVMGGFIYEVTALIITVPDRFRQSTLPISTSVPPQDPAVALADLRTEITDLYQRSTGRIDRLEGTMLEAMEALQAETADNFLKREVVKKATDNSAAAILEERQARTTAIDAEARAREQAIVSIDDDIEAAVLEERQARTTAISAEATAREQAIAGIADIDTQIAEGYSDIQAEVSQDGSSVLISHVARVTTDGDFEQAGLYLHVETEEDGTVASKVLVDADRFIITDGVDDKTPFRIIDGELIFDGVIRSSDNKFRIDGGIGQILISD